MNRITLLLLLPALLLACGDSTAQTENATSTGISTPEQMEQQQASAPANSDAEFADAMTDKVFQNYLHLRSALVRSDATEAASTAGNMAEGFGPERWDLKELAQRIADSDELEVQRGAFATLGTKVEELFTNGMTEGTIYKMHCPMAFDGAGADWFSEVAEVRNPFYGDKMLTCGKVTDTISK
ncbi:hypothetical protein LEM8419_03470 [Neolewinella maritima]|uniref:DUF3347 domain-containing protein n=1 Tax=Neolewinella maritima TaxID=1383882 RepID=A0ABN8FE35_9BACT|nr:DUF3347 domain-containing protein [Neolewinella maritima]CAH1002598.1 hypothetical protein LEM8419_03470 [Neolewinella maritima]